MHLDTYFVWDKLYCFEQIAFVQLLPVLQSGEAEGWGPHLCWFQQYKLVAWWAARDYLPSGASKVWLIGVQRHELPMPAWLPQQPWLKVAPASCTHCINRASGTATSLRPTATCYSFCPLASVAPWLHIMLQPATAAAELASQAHCHRWGPPPLMATHGSQSTWGFHHLSAGPSLAVISYSAVS